MKSNRNPMEKHFPAMQITIYIYRRIGEFFLFKIITRAKANFPLRCNFYISRKQKKFPFILEWCEYTKLLLSWCLKTKCKSQKEIRRDYENVGQIHNFSQEYLNYARDIANAPFKIFSIHDFFIILWILISLIISE